MLVKLLPKDVPTWVDVINETIDKSLPECEERIKTNYVNSLLIGTCQCWIVYKEEDKFEGVLITQIREDFAVGCKSFNLLAMYAPNGTENNSFINNWETLRKYAIANDCKVFDFYSDNEEAIKYARLFDIKWETTYFQINI